MCHVLIKVTVTFWQESVCYLIFWKVYIYIAAWAGELKNTGCSEWWSFCVIDWQFLQQIICSNSDFHTAMPTKFCNLPYISIIYWKLHMSYLKFFSHILQIFVWNVWCCTDSNFVMLVIYPLFIAVVVVSYLCVYLSCWVATYLYSWINIYRGWTNNGNTRQYRNKTVCVGCTERKLVVSFIILLFVCAV